MARLTLNLVRLTSVAVAVFGSTAAHAEPLTLTASHNVTHDANFARTPTPVSDTINTTTVSLSATPSISEGGSIVYTVSTGSQVAGSDRGSPKSSAQQITCSAGMCCDRRPPKP